MSFKEMAVGRFTCGGFFIAAIELALIHPSACPQR